MPPCSVHPCPCQNEFYPLFLSLPLPVHHASLKGCNSIRNVSATGTRAAPSFAVRAVYIEQGSRVKSIENLSSARDWQMLTICKWHSLRGTLRSRFPGSQNATVFRAPCPTVKRPIDISSVQQDSCVSSH